MMVHKASQALVKFQRTIGSVVPKLLMLKHSCRFVLKNGGTLAHVVFEAGITALCLGRRHVHGVVPWVREPRDRSKAELEIDTGDRIILSGIARESLMQLKRLFSIVTLPCIQFKLLPD